MRTFASRRASSSARRAAAHGAALAAVLAACGGGPAAPAGAPAPAGRIVGTPVTASEPTPEVTRIRAPAAGGLVPVEIVARSPRGRARHDVPITYRNVAGGAARTVLTGADGVAKLRLAPGRYRVDAVIGCGARMHVTSAPAGGGVLGVPKGGGVRMTLVVNARARFWAGSPVTWTPEVPWDRGARVTFRYSLFDRCTKMLAPNTDVGRLVYRPAAHLRVHERSMRSDREAYVTVVLACTGSGDGPLTLADPHEPGDTVDLFSLRPTFDPNARRCA